MIEYFIVVIFWLLLIWCFLLHEVSIYRRGGDVFDHTKKLDKLLKRFGL
jgi:hypothetical protein